MEKNSVLLYSKMENAMVKGINALNISKKRNKICAGGLHRTKTKPKVSLAYESFKDPTRCMFYFHVKLILKSMVRTMLIIDNYGMVALDEPGGKRNLVWNINGQHKII